MLTEGTESERLPTVSAFTREVPGLLRKILKTPIYNKQRSKSGYHYLI